MVQWWYGHNAVGFFLTAGFLAIMYYFVPKQADRPVYSYRLSIVHFWALIFIYIWAGPHHLHYTALPDWAQTLGMVFSIMLWMPSWGGMINGLMTLSRRLGQAAHRSGAAHDGGVRRLLRHVDLRGSAHVDQGGELAVSHYTDWTIGHVHSGALGWVGYISFGAIYCLVPWLWNRSRLYSLKLVNWHFWVSTLGIVLYISAMWVSGILQGLMWRAYTALGFLEYSFIETSRSDAPVLRHPRARRALVPRRRTDHGLQHLEDDHGRRARSERRPRVPSSCRPSKGDTMSVWAKARRSSRRTRSSFSSASSIVVAIGGLVEIAPLFYLKSTIENGARACAPTPRSSWPAATSTSARAATTATRR